MRCKASAPPGARAGQAAGKKDGVPKFVKVVQGPGATSTKMWELHTSFLELWLNGMMGCTSSFQLRDLKELPPGIRGRFTEIFVDEVGWIVSCLMKLNSQLGSSSEVHAFQHCVFVGMLQLLWAHTVFSTKLISASLDSLLGPQLAKKTKRNPRGIPP